LFFAVPWSYSRETLPRSHPTFVVLTLALLACSSEAPPASSGGGSVQVSPPSGNAASGGCSDSAASHPAGTSCVTVVHGQLIDSADAPVTAPVSVCGGAVLCTGSAANEGLFNVTVNRYVDLSTFVLHVYGHPYHGDMITRLARATTSDIALNSLPRVPRMENKGDVLPPTAVSSTVVRSGPIELTLAAGATTVVEPAHENTRELLSGAVPDAAKWDAGVVALYAVGPFDAQFSPAAAVAITLPATATIADGTTLDLVVLEDDITAGVTAGTLVKVGSATVTKGIARSVVGGGLTRLTWVGVRTPKGG
jgi:hypothetical protein